MLNVSVFAAMTKPPSGEAMALVRTVSPATIPNCHIPDFITICIYFDHNYSLSAAGAVTRDISTRSRICGSSYEHIAMLQE